MKKVAVGLRILTGFSQLTTGNLALSIQQSMGTCFKPGKGKAEKEEGWTPSFVCCAQNTVGL